MIQPLHSFANLNPGRPIGHVTVVGGGRIGSFFAKLTHASLVTRTEGQLQVSGPILVCVRGDDLEGLISETPLDRRKDLVFIQNGMIDDLLRKWDLEASTRGILYFAIESRGSSPVDGGETVFSGDYGPWLVSILHSANIGAKEVSRVEFNREMGRKLIWNSVFGLLGEAYGTSVGQTLDHHREEIRGLVHELQSVFENATSIALGADLEEQLVSYAKKVTFYQSRASEWSWRNGWFLKQEETSLHKQLSLRIGK